MPSQETRRREPRTLVVLGASSDQLFLIRTAREMGLSVLAFDQNPASPGFREGLSGYCKPKSASKISNSSSSLSGRPTIEANPGDMIRGILSAPLSA